MKIHGKNLLFCYFFINIKYVVVCYCCATSEQNLLFVKISSKKKIIHTSEKIDLSKQIVNLLIRSQIKVSHILRDKINLDDKLMFIPNYDSKITPFLIY